MHARTFNGIGVMLAVLFSTAPFAAPAAGAGGSVSADTRPVPARVPGSRPAAPAGIRAGAIIGVAWNAVNRPIPGARVRLRNVVTGRVPLTAIASDTGQFTFKGVESGSYLIELVTENGKILTVGHPFTIAAGETVATFVRLAARPPWFEGFFGNAASAVASTAASAGVTAIAPETKPCSSPSPGCN